MKKILFILVIINLISFVSAWESPTSVITKSSENAGFPATNAIDGNTGTNWNEIGEPTDNDPDNIEWMILVDIGSTKNVSQFRVYADGNSGTTSPCSVEVAKVCDDSACSGESDILSSDCTFSAALEWQECDIPDTLGRYLKIQGGYYSAGCNTFDVAVNMNDFFELEVETFTLLGEACSEDVDCISGFCADSVCCDTACDAVCYSCLAEYTASSNGTCAEIDADTDPMDDCGIVQCDDGSGTPYYYDWFLLECFYRDDVAAASVDCKAGGTCEDDSDLCGTQGKGDSSGVICGCSSAMLNCTGFLDPVCDDSECGDTFIFNITNNVSITVNNTINIDSNDSVWFSQIYQIIEDLSLWFMRDEDTCQVVADNDLDFSSPEINRHVYITEYTHDEYLAQDNYYWKARCRRSDRWSMWSDMDNFTHVNESVYFDWTVR